MNHNSIWAVLEESADILGGYGYPAMDKAAAEAGLSPDYFSWVAAVNLFAPHSFTLAQFMRIFPYGLPKVNEARLAFAVQQSFLTFGGQGQYCATESGINIAIYRVFKAANDSIASLRPMPEESLTRLVNLLTRLVDAALERPNRQLNSPPVTNANRTNGSVKRTQWRAWHIVALNWKATAMTRTSLHGRLIVLTVTHGKFLIVFRKTTN